MNSPHRTIRALGLCSGGLDSMLSGLVLREQGIAVEWVAFETPFFAADKARKASRLTGIPLRVQPIFPEYLAMLRNPRAGYGRQMNPCMDCHALMFRLAGEVLRAEGFDFLFSGEVLGQRPMSQTHESLDVTSAKLLPETLPEKEGWVNRERLLAISGRGRKDQIELAKKFGIAEYPAPAGGCLLTEKGFSVRLRDLFDHQTDCTENDVHLLKFGRHFRLSPSAKMIVGRTEEDNEGILAHHDPERDVVLDLKNHPSPIGLIPLGAEERTLLLGASICVGYSKAPRLAPVPVIVKRPQGESIVQVIAVLPDDVRKLMI